MKLLSEAMEKEIKINLRFCRLMLEKVKNTEYEDKWKRIYVVLSDPEKLNQEQSNLIIETFKEIRKYLRHRKSHPEENVVKHVHETVLITEQRTAPIVEKILSSLSNLSLTPMKTQEVIDNNIHLNLPEESAPKLSAHTPTETSKRPKIPTLKLKLNEIFNKNRLKRLEKKKRKNEKLRTNKKEERKMSHLTPASVTQNISEEAQPNLAPTALVLNLNEDFSEPKILKSTPIIESVRGGVDFEVEIKNIKTEEVEEIVIPESSIQKASKAVKKRIAHMSYKIEFRNVRFYCHICKNYSTRSKQIFMRHIQEHKFIRWFGGCSSCSKDNHSGGTVMHEFHHMINYHISKELPEIQSNQKTKEMSPMISIPSDALNLSAQVNSSPIASSSTDIVLLDISSTMHKIKPWMSSWKHPHRKYQGACNDMIKIECLSAMFKCMGSTCSFYTSDASLFSQHLTLHSKYQSSDSGNFLCCSYCDFNENDRKLLIKHITKVHCAEEYQCSYCFYRSYIFQIFDHQATHHKNLKKKIIFCKTSKPKISRDPETVWKKCIRNVPAMSCMMCKEKFFNFTLFETHLKNHSDSFTAKCLKCKNPIDLESVLVHLKRCHGFGIIQCGFCRFGANCHSTFKQHLASNHPNESTSFYFDRRHPDKGFIENMVKYDDELKMSLVMYPSEPTADMSRSILEASTFENTRNEINVAHLSRNFHIKL